MRSSVGHEVELSSQSDVVPGLDALFVLEDIEDGRCDRGDVGNTIVSEIA